MGLFVRLRRFRHLSTSWWIGVLVLALVVGFTVATSVSKAQAGVARFGGLVSVSVATHPLDAGTAVTNNDERVVSWPRSLLPASPIAGDPQGRVVTVPVVAGAPIVEGNLAPGGLSAVAALLKKDEQAIAIPTGPATPALQVGDNVRVFTITDKVAETTSVPATARVVATSEPTVTIAVASADAARVSASVAQSTIVLTVTRPDAPAS